MAGRSIGPIGRSKLAFAEYCKTTDNDTLVALYGEKCDLYHPNARNCPICFIWKQAAKGLWYPLYLFPDGKYYAVPKAELGQRLWKAIKSQSR